MNYTIDHKAETILVTITCDNISNKRYLKPIFSLLFFEHGYLGEYLSYRYDIFNRGQKHSYAGKSDFSLRMDSSDCHLICLIFAFLFATP